MKDDPTPLTALHLEQLAPAVHRAAAECSAALTKWLAAPATISIERTDQCLLSDLPQLFGEPEEAICLCLMQMQGTLSGQMLLAFDDASGLSMTDLILGRPMGTAREWGEVERSSALETMNIAGSMYLNGLAAELSRNGATITLIPTPPRFHRDFAESLLQTAFMNQAVIGRYLVYSEACFALRDQPLHWTFLLIPDPPSLVQMRKLLESLHLGVDPRNE